MSEFTEVPKKCISKFEKVSFEQFKNDMIDNFGHMIPNIEQFIANAYNNIQLPKRATKGSAGYDFFAPFDINIPAADSIIIPTGIRCKIRENFFLSVYPRSGLGFKYRAGLDNTVGIIDSDYYDAPNEGHILIKIHHGLNETVTIETGKAFAQGIFTEYGYSVDDDTDGERIGGFGSTSENN